MKKEYKAPYFRPRFMTAIEPLMVSQEPEEKDPFNGGFTDEEIDEVVDTLQSGWITTGPKTKKFENMITKFCISDRTVCLDSCTSALEMTLRILGVKRGDEVIVPAYTYTATASVTQHVGCKLVMVDSQKDSVEMDYDQLEKAISEKTKVIAPVDIELDDLLFLFILISSFI